MWSRRSTRTSGSRAQRGYTLAELLVGLALGSTVALTATSGYVFFVGSWDNQAHRLDTQQHLREAVDMLTREVRLAGACLPSVGPTDIRALNGSDGGATDTITVRANVRCAIASLTAAASAGATSIPLDTTANFTAGMQIYILHADTTRGEYATVVGINVAASGLNLTFPISQGYPQASSVYGVEAWTYAVDASGANPALTVTVTTGGTEPAVAGIERLNVRYVLDRNCAPGPCDVIDLPASSGEWAVVRAVWIDLTARSSRRIPAGEADGFFRLRQTIEVKPRNFLF